MIDQLPSYSVVVTREDAPGEKRLIAYVVPIDPAEGARGVARLREELERELPDYMLPDAIAL